MSKQMFSYRKMNFIALLICIAAMLFAVLYLERTLFLDPCPLCILDRVVIVAIGFIFLLAFIFNPMRWVAKLFSTLTALLSIVGIGLASRHIWLQNLPKDQVPECGPDLYFMLDTLPFFDVIKNVFTGSGSCAEVSWTFAGLTIPEQTLVLFVVLFVVSLVQLIRPR